MKKEYIPAELTLVEFEGEDIITTSNPGNPGQTPGEPDDSIGG